MFNEVGRAQNPFTTPPEGNGNGKIRSLKAAFPSQSDK